MLWIIKNLIGESLLDDDAIPDDRLQHQRMGPNRHVVADDAGLDMRGRMNAGVPPAKDKRALPGRESVRW